MGGGFLKRLGWYLVGFSIGLVFLVFILKNKSGEGGFEICYFPNCRVLKDIRSKPFFTNQNLKDTLRFEDLEKNLQDILLHGTIDFGKSDTKSKPCKTYYITHDDIDLITKIKNCPEKAILQ